VGKAAPDARRDLTSEGSLMRAIMIAMEDRLLSIGVVAFVGVPDGSIGEPRRTV